MPHLPPRPWRCPTGAFTLIEVVLALGITSFCLVGLIGLFSVGIQAERESTERLEASHIAQSLIAARRASATVPDPANSNFPIQKLVVGQSTSGLVTAYLDENGAEAPSLGDARFRLSYRIDAPAAGELKPFTLYLKITWPAAADPQQGQQAGSVEHTTYISSRQ